MTVLRVLTNREGHTLTAGENEAILTCSRGKITEEANALIDIAGTNGLSKIANF